jgi:hypothetical protein
MVWRVKGEGRVKFPGVADVLENKCDAETMEKPSGGPINFVLVATAAFGNRLDVPTFPFPFNNVQ